LGPVYSDGINWSTDLVRGKFRFATCEPSSSQSDRYTMFAVGVGIQQELSVYEDANQNLIAFFTDGGAHIVYSYCAAGLDPLTQGSWTTPIVVIGGGVGGEAATFAHSGLYQEGGNLYIFGQQASTHNINIHSASATFTLATGPVFSFAATAFTGVVGGGSSNGNSAPFKAPNGSYYIMQEALMNQTFPTEGATNTWNFSLLKSATLLGTYARQINFVTSLMVSPNASSSGAQVIVEGPNLVCFYHGGGYGRCLPTDIYRGIIPAANVDTDTWTITNGGAGTATRHFNPTLLARSTMLEFDQVADPWVVRRASGAAYLFYEGANNRAGLANFQAMITPMIPCPYQADTALIHPIRGAVNAGPEPPYWQLYAQPWQNSPIPMVAGLLTITAITKAASAVFTSSSTAAVNPFSVGETVTFASVVGMVEINGLTGTLTAVGGATGAWTGTVNINSTGFTTYTSGGTVSIGFDTNPALSPTPTGTWSDVYNAASPGGSIRTNVSAASGDEYYFAMPYWGNGAFKMVLTFLGGPDKGIAQFQLGDGSANWSASPRSVDMYNSVDNSLTTVTFTNFWIFGYEKFSWSMRVITNTKNAASTGFKINWVNMSMQRTGSI
jgi:hypothetical protein